MRLISKEFIDKNINHHYEITTETQNSIRIGNAQYIVETGKMLQLNAEVVSIAIIYTQLFFLKKCYLNYEKELICNSALYFTSKNLNHKRKLSDFCLNYQKLKYFGQLFKPMNDAQKNELIEEICIAECQILKCIAFDLEIETPYRYLERFCKCLYPDSFQNIYKLALAICNDSFYTYCNVIFSAQSIAVAAIMFAAVKFGLDQPSEPDFNFDQVFEKLYLKGNKLQGQHQNGGPQLISGSQITHIENDKELRSEFEKLSWCKKIDKEVDLEEVVETLRMVQEFYANFESNRQQQQTNGGAK